MGSGGRNRVLLQTFVSDPSVLNSRVGKSVNAVSMAIHSLPFHESPRKLLGDSFKDSNANER